MVMPVTTDNRKTQQKRKRIAKQKLRDVKAKERKLAKQREQEFFRLRSLKREVRETEAEFAQRQVDRKAAAQAALAKPRQFGSIKYTEPKVAVKLTDELTDSLRNLKPEDNLFKDRFHSMQKRNMIEVRGHGRLWRGGLGVGVGGVSVWWGSRCSARGPGAMACPISGRSR